MELYITDLGTIVKKRDDLFEITTSEKKVAVAPQKIKSLVLAKGIFFTTDEIKLAVENNIDIVIIDDFGNPYGRFWQSKFGSTANIRRKQLEIFGTQKGVEIAKQILIQKIKNCAEHLEDLKIKRESKKEFLDEKIKEMKKYIYQIKLVEGDINAKRGTLMGYEGNAGKIYYQTLSELMPKEFKFEKRSMHPAQDEFNAMLNYAFGILYSKVEKACIIAGLDPYIGIIHTDNYGKKSLVFDIIEGYRHLASRTVFSLFTQKKVQKYFFKREGDGVTLVGDGKKVLVESFYNRLEKKIRYNNRNISSLDKLQFECHELANRLISK